MGIATVHLGGAGVSTSRLGFGTTSLLALDNEQDRFELLAAALDLGIRHFDTAPYYGYGQAERTLGRFLKGRRDGVTVTTKFGIAPPRVAGVATVASLAKRLTRKLGPLRRLLSRQAGRLVQRNAFGVEDARRSLESSLRALGTEYIDVYLLHEAGPAEVSEDLLAFLIEQQARGVIRTFGIGSELDRTIGVLNCCPSIARVVQIENNVVRRNFERLPAGVEAAMVTHRALGEAFRELSAQYGADRDLAERCSAEVGADCSDKAILGGLMLSYAVRSNPAGVVLFSSRSRSHLERNVAVIAGQRFSAGQVDAFARFVARSQGRP